MAVQQQRLPRVGDDFFVWMLVLLGKACLDAVVTVRHSQAHSKQYWCATTAQQRCLVRFWVRSSSFFSFSRKIGDALSSPWNHWEKDGSSELARASMVTAGNRWFGDDDWQLIWLDRRRGRSRVEKKGDKSACPRRLSSMSQEKFSFRLYRYSCDYKDNRRNRAKKVPSWNLVLYNGRGWLAIRAF